MHETLKFNALIISTAFTPYVPLPDEYPSMVNALSQTQLEHLCLKSSLQEIFHFQTQNIIELHSRFIQHSNPNKSTQEGVALKQPTGALLFESE